MTNHPEIPAADRSNRKRGILIEVSRDRNAGIISKWTELSNSGAALLYSPVSVAELWAGARPAEYNALNNLFRALICIPIDADTGRQAGAQHNHALLWTQNRKHYPMKNISFFG